MLTIASLILVAFIINISYLFISYNFLYDFRIVENQTQVQSYHILKQNNELFEKYFENTDETVYTQLYWLVPPGKKIMLWHYPLNNPEITFIWDVCFNDDCYNINWTTQINKQWYYEITLKTNNWVPYLIKNVNYSYTCNNWVYKQTISDFNLERTYTVFTSTNGDDLNLQVSANNNWTDVNLTWTIPWNSKILNKYIIKIYKNGTQVWTDERWDSVCNSTLNCSKTIQGDVSDTYQVKIKAEGILEDCWILSDTN